MRKTLIGCLALGILGAASAASAGTVYVPVPDPVGPAGSSHSLQVWITNSSTAQRPYKALFLEANKDGTQRPAQIPETPVLAGKTSVLGGIGTRGKVGMLEINANPAMTIEARLFNTSPKGQVSSSPVPVISSENLFEAGETAVVQGLLRDLVKGDSSSLGIVNLGKQTSRCEIKVFRVNGTQVGATASLTFAPLSLSYFPDAFGILGETQASDARIQVACNQPFYTYATILFGASAQLAFVPPSASGASTLTAPGEPGGGGTPTPSGAFVFTAGGLLHTAVRGDEKEAININLPEAMRVKKLVLDMDFVPGPWNNLKLQNNHAIVWLYRGKFRGNTIANVNAFSPKSTLKASQNINLGPEEATGGEAGVPWQQGKKYHLKYTYDAVTRNVNVVLSADGQTLKTFNFDATSTGGVLDIPKTGLKVEFGHFGTEPGPEVASYGWKYYDLRIEFIP